MSTCIFDTITWTKQFEYQEYYLDHQPAGGYTQHFLDRYYSSPLSIPVPPVDQTWIAAGNTSVVEGDANTVYMKFPVRLSRASSVPVTVNYATTETGDAQAGIDYLPVHGLLTFAPGQTLKYVTVAIPGNRPCII